MSTTSTPSLGQLQRALKISEQIQELRAELAGVLGRATEPAAAKPVKTAASEPRIKRKYTKKSSAPSKSAAAAEAVESFATVVEPAAAGKKRYMSPEAREKIAAAQRARWAKQFKKAKKG